jgi:hypothetical protein
VSKSHIRFTCAPTLCRARTDAGCGMCLSVCVCASHASRSCVYVFVGVCACVCACARVYAHSFVCIYAWCLCVHACVLVYVHVGLCTYVQTSALLVGRGWQRTQAWSRAGTHGFSRADIHKYWQCKDGSEEDCEGGGSGHQGGCTWSGGGGETEVRKTAVSNSARAAVVRAAV